MRVEAAAAAHIATVLPQPKLSLMKKYDVIVRDGGLSAAVLSCDLPAAALSCVSCVREACQPLSRSYDRPTARSPAKSSPDPLSVRVCRRPMRARRDPLRDRLSETLDERRRNSVAPVEARGAEKPAN